MNYYETNGETLEQYTHRLCSLKKEYNLSWSDITDNINKNFDKNLSKDFIRHEWYGMKKMQVIEVQKEDGYKKILIMTDLHIPYEREDVLEEIEKNKDVDTIVFGGDLADCKSCSFFPDFNKPSLEEELIAVHDFIVKVNEIIDPKKTRIIAIRGNHEYRLKRDIMGMHEKHLSKMINPNMLGMIANGFVYYDKNKDIHYKPIENFEYVDEFYIRLFDNLIVAHPLDFSGVEGSVSLKMADYFLNEGIAERGDILVYGHTHKQSSIYVNRRQGLFVIENGCLCQPHEYSKMGKLSFTPQNYAYTLIKFKEGEKIDKNDIKVVHLK